MQKQDEMRVQDRLDDAKKAAGFMSAHFIALSAQLQTASGSLLKKEGSGSGEKIRLYLGFHHWREPDLNLHIAEVSSYSPKLAAHVMTLALTLQAILPDLKPDKEGDSFECTAASAPKLRAVFDSAARQCEATHRALEAFPDAAEVDRHLAVAQKAYDRASSDPANQ